VFDQQDLNRLFRYCCALCDARPDAYDLLQSAIERCIRTPPDDPERRIAYAMRVIRNLHYDQLRRQRVVVFEPLEDSSQLPQAGMDSLESIMIDRDELEHAWRRMTTVEREIIYLWAVEGLSAAEISVQLERPRGSVLSIVHRMRKRLQTQNSNTDRASQA